MTRDPAIVGKQPIPVPRHPLSALNLEPRTQMFAMPASDDVRRHSQVLVDGAHALGQIHVDIQALGDPDYYLSNGHKWFYTPKSAVTTPSHSLPLLGPVCALWSCCVPLKDSPDC
eukprot:1798626-Rhodomonas_salina.1